MNNQEAFLLDVLAVIITIALAVILLVVVVKVEQHVYRRNGAVAAVLFPIRFVLACVLAYWWSWAMAFWVFLALAFTPWTLIYSFLANDWSRSSFFGIMAIVGYLKSLKTFWEWTRGDPSANLFAVLRRETFGIRPE